MEYFSKELIDVLRFLLPGFITTFFFYSLTSFPKKSEFDKIVMALIFTIIINIFVEGLGFVFISLGKKKAIGEWSPEIKALWSVIIAFAIGIPFTFIYNNDVLHRVFRKFKITNQTSYPSEWYGTFSETDSYIVLHFTDGRRLMGHPLEWPINPKSGHFVLEDAVWLVEEDGKISYIELPTVSKLMVDTTKIEMVEFLKENEEKSDAG